MLRFPDDSIRRNEVQSSVITFLISPPHLTRFYMFLSVPVRTNILDGIMHTYQN